VPTKCPEEGRDGIPGVRRMDIDQVVRRWLAGEKIRAIARLTGADRNTVRRIVPFGTGRESDGRRRGPTRGTFK
jgi:transposase